MAVGIATALVPSSRCLAIEPLGKPVAEPPGRLTPPKHGNLYVVAHRGAHQGIPENTLAAYRKAIELDCDFVEIDVRTTKDGVLVSVHDASIERYVLEGRKGRVEDMTLLELKDLDIGSRISTEYAQERVPTVEEILELCRGKIGIYLDIKQADLEALLSLVRKYEMESETLWYIPASKVETLRALSPSVWPMPDPGEFPRLDPLIRTTKPRVVAAVWRHFSREFVTTCHAHQALTIVDEGGKESWPLAIEWGADGIQTDHPQELIEYLKSRP